MLYLTFPDYAVGIDCGAVLHKEHEEASEKDF